MADQSLKQQTRKGFIWSAIDKFSTQSIQFIIGVILARLLDPSDFGIIGMLAIFLAISNSIINGGFVNALIQKNDCNQRDYSTVFFFNVITGGIFYVVMYFAAPYIAEFYKMPILISVTRVVALTLFINSLMIVQTTKLTKELNFKLQAKIRFVCNFVAGIVALIMAYSGYGVWSLVFQMVLSCLLTCMLFWVMSKWKPSLVFSIESFKKLFSFGSNLLITGLYGPIFDNINTFLIGRIYTPTDLGFYTRANSLVQFPSSNITGIVSSVSYPVLSKLQDDPERLTSGYRKLIKTTYFIVFPLMGGLIVAAEPFVGLVLGEKWLPAVPYVQVLCVSLSFYPICAYNINALLVKGKAGLHLRLDLVKKIVTIIILSITASLGIIYICFGSIIGSFFSWFITAYYSGRLLNLSLWQQIKDISKSLIVTLIMCISVFFVLFIEVQPWLQLLMQILLGGGIYYVLSYFFNYNQLVEFNKFIFKK